MNKKVVAIIGGGFSGLTLVCHLVKNAANGSLKILLFSAPELFLKGFAYNPYSKRHLLNVSAGKMGAFEDEIEGYLNFLMTTETYKDLDRSLVANAFTPRYLFGEYLADLWVKCLRLAADKNISIEVIFEEVNHLDKDETLYYLLTNSSTYSCTHCVLATGNALPALPKIANDEIFNHSSYVNNPWSVASVDRLSANLPVLILGNGLTMVDAVIGLIEKGFKGEILTVSPNGFHILPHRHGGIKYMDLVHELKEEMQLAELVSLVNKHVKKVRRLGLSAEPVIDSMRPYVQKYWCNFTENERSIFLSRLRHLWGVARHRIPIHIHDKLVRLQLEGRLRICKGKIHAITAVNSTCLEVVVKGRSGDFVEMIQVQRIINCTGPQMNYSREVGLLGNCVRSGLLKQDIFHLGISTCLENYQTRDANDKENKKLYAVGSLLRGELWETTSVPDIRVQTEQLAKIILSA